jgi:hypothetical protein
MKSTIKILIAITLIVLSLSRPIKKERRESALTKDEGSGSWDTGFTCPKIYVSGTAKDLSYKINPKSFSQDSGFVIQIDTAKSNIGAFLRTIGSKTFIPWRFFSLTSSDKWFGSNKYIETILKNDEGTTKKVQFAMAYKTFGNFITTEEVQKIVNMINNFSNAEKTSINNIKSDLKTLKKNLSASQNAKKSSTQDLKTFTDKVNAQIAADNKIITDNNAKRTALENSIADKKTEFEKLNAQLKSTTTNISLLDKEHSNALEIKNGQNNSSLLSIKNIDDIIAKTKTNISNYVTKIKNLAVNADVTGLLEAANAAESTKANAILLNITPQ